MTPERWEQVESIARAALDRTREQRAAFLEDACAADTALRLDVESLLAYERAAESFLATPALEEAARAVAADIPLGFVDFEIAGYDMAELLGAGGTGDVYRARDQRLDRDVAVKILPLVQSDAASVARFEAEARAASALNHPNIVTVYAVGTEDDTAYIVMEFVAGRTLRAMLSNGPLPLKSTLDIVVQLADGLAAAHAAGIVHRDLKPENIMVTPDGFVKILDFGIAKREGAAASPSLARASGERSVHTDTITGTVGYMAPEQAAGRPVDHRADQFSFGAVVYELHCGRRAFEGGSKEETVRSILEGQYPPIADRSGRAAEALRRVIERCLSREPEKRYAVTRDLASALRVIRDMPRLDVERNVIGRRRVIWFAGMTLAAAAAGYGVWRARPAGAVRRLAVLPFANVSNDAAAEYLCDGIPKVLIDQLGRMPPLAVTSYGTVFGLKGKQVDPREVGETLGVDEVLLGSVERIAGRTEVKVELVDAKTGQQIWNDKFGRVESDVLAIQEDLAGAIITNGLRLRLSDEENRLLRRTLTADPEAYRLFLRAIHQFRLETEAGYRAARGLLTEAIAHDRRFALALVTLASTFSVMAVDGYEAPRGAWDQSRMYVDRALDVDSSLPDAHAERAAEAFFYRWDWAAARREWDEALKSSRGGVQAELLSVYGLQQWALGRTDEALRFARDARVVDPVSPMLAVREADLLATSGRLDVAANIYTKVIEDHPQERRAYFGLANVRGLQRQFDSAIDAYRRFFAGEADDALDDVLQAAEGADGYRRLEQALAERELAAVTERSRSGAYASPIDFARASARLGRTEETFRYLDAAFADHSAVLVFLNVDRAWDSVRSDSRFTAMVKRVGLA